MEIWPENNPISFNKYKCFFLLTKGEREKKMLSTKLEASDKAAGLSKKV